MVVEEDDFKVKYSSSCCSSNDFADSWKGEKRGISSAFVVEFRRLFRMVSRAPETSLTKARSIRAGPKDFRRFFDEVPLKENVLFVNEAN